MQVTVKRFIKSGGWGGEGAHDADHRQDGGEGVITSGREGSMYDESRVDDSVDCAQVIVTAVFALADHGVARVFRVR